MASGYTSIERLSELIESRKAESAPRSYTNELFEQGMKSIGSKVMEEASEFVTAAHDLEIPENADSPEPRNVLVREAADLLYHAMVLLANYDVSLSDVDEEIRQRLPRKIQPRSGESN